MRRNLNFKMHFYGINCISSCKLKNEMGNIPDEGIFYDY